MAEVAGRSYIPTTYAVARSRQPVVDVLLRGIELGGGRVIHCSFPEERRAPIVIGIEEPTGSRVGLVVYPFTATRRETTNRPPDERRAQIKFGDFIRHRDLPNPIAQDPAGVDVTLVLTVDPEEQFIVGLAPLVYADLPMGISVYYRDEHVDAASETGWAVWEGEKHAGVRRPKPWDGLETLVGFRPERLLDYVRFEARASSLGLTTGLRTVLAETYSKPSERHDLERLFGLSASEILDIVNSNFRLGVAVRGGVAERHLERELAAEPDVVDAQPIDTDGQPDFRVTTASGSTLLIECKTSSRHAYADGDLKVEAQKTRDSGAGRKYSFAQFDVLAVCLFPVTGRWEFRYRWVEDLVPWEEDRSRIRPIQRIDGSWVKSIEGLGPRPTALP